MPYKIQFLAMTRHDPQNRAGQGAALKVTRLLIGEAVLKPGDARVLGDQLYRKYQQQIDRYVRQGAASVQYLPNQSGVLPERPPIPENITMVANLKGAERLTRFTPDVPPDFVKIDVTIEPDVLPVPEFAAAEPAGTGNTLEPPALVSTPAEVVERSLAPAEAPAEVPVPGAAAAIYAENPQPPGTPAKAKRKPAARP